jgi:hypothetical protein
MMDVSSYDPIMLFIVAVHTAVLMKMIFMFDHRLERIIKALIGPLVICASVAFPVYVLRLASNARETVQAARPATAAVREHGKIECAGLQIRRGGCPVVLIVTARDWSGPVVVEIKGRRDKAAEALKAYPLKSRVSLHRTTQRGQLVYLSDHNMEGVKSQLGGLTKRRMVFTVFLALLGVFITWIYTLDRGRASVRNE